MQIIVYDDINIPPNLMTAFHDVQIPQGNWRIVSLVALASVTEIINGVSVNVITGDVETMVSLNQAERFRATEEGIAEPFITGGVLVRAAATKKISLGPVFVRVAITLEQS